MRLCFTSIGARDQQSSRVKNKGIARGVAQWRHCVIPEVRTKRRCRTKALCDYLHRLASLPSLSAPRVTLAYPPFSNPCCMLVVSSSAGVILIKNKESTPELLIGGESPTPQHASCGEVGGPAGP